MRSEKIICDVCEREWKNCDSSWFTLNNLKMMRGEPPRLDREIHVCGTKCLGQWSLSASKDIERFNSEHHQSPLGNVPAQNTVGLLLH